MIDIIKRSFKTLFENPILIAPYAFMILTVAIAAGMIFLINLPGYSIITIILSVIIAVLAILLYIFFGIGSIGMVKDALLNKKASLKSMMVYGRKFWLRYAWLALLQTLILLASFAVAVGITLAAALASSTLAILLGAISFIAAILFNLLFMLSPWYLVLEEKSAVHSLGKSFNVIKKNYGYFLLLTAIFAIFSFVPGLIPYAGALISLLLIGPAKTIAYMIFALSKKS